MKRHGIFLGAQWMLRFFAKQDRCSHSGRKQCVFCGLLSLPLTFKAIATGADREHAVKRKIIKSGVKGFEFEHRLPHSLSVELWGNPYIFYKKGLVLKAKPLAVLRGLNVCLCKKTLWMTECLKNIFCANGNWVSSWIASVIMVGVSRHGPIGWVMSYPLVSSEQ